MQRRPPPRAAFFYFLFDNALASRRLALEKE